MFRTIAALILLSGSPLLVNAHEGHDHTSATSSKAASPASKTHNSTDQNSYVADGQTFVWKHRPDLGKQSAALIEAAKGGLHNSADRDLVTGEVVTVVANHGLVTLDADLKEWKLVEDQDAAFAGGMNAHGADCFLLDDQSYWVFASTNTNEVIVSKRGTIVATLTSPTGDEFDNPNVNEYFAGGGKFTPCDVVYLPQAQRLVVVIGYTPGDFALSAERVDGRWQWAGAAWGGKEAQGGPFNTAHGIEVHTAGGRETVEVASRSHGRVLAFTPHGAQIKMPGKDESYHIQLPEGSHPCDVSRWSDSMFLPLLNGQPKRADPASVIVLENGNTVGRLTPSAFDNLSRLLHMHGFLPYEKDGKLFGIVLSWRQAAQNDNGVLNDGQIAIFEAVPTS